MGDAHQRYAHGRTAVGAFLVLLAVLVGATATADSVATGSSRQELIAFVSTSSGTAQLYTVRSDTSRLRQLTDDPVGFGWPRWSADGKRLLVLTGCKELSGLCPDPTGFAIMRRNGSHRVDIAGTRPVFSPNGKRLAYLECSGSSCNLFVTRANGRHRILIDANVRKPFFPGEPAWSSDSTKLVYVKAAPSFGEMSIWLADLRGGGKVEVLTGIGAPVSTSVFFPNDMTIVFVAGFAARLFSISLGETEAVRRGLIGESGYLVQSPTRTRLASQGFSQGPGGFISAFSGDINQFGEFTVEFRAPKPNSYDPVWSPDGSRIAYTFCDRSSTSFPGGPCSIQIVGTGSSPLIIYGGPAMEGSDWVRGYDWSPDASALVLSASQSGNPFRLSLVNADGSGLTPLLSGSDNQYTPAWQPQRLPLCEETVSHEDEDDGQNNDCNLKNNIDDEGEDD